MQPVAVEERVRHTQDSQNQIMVLAFWQKSLKRLNLFPPRPEGGVTGVASEEVVDEAKHEESARGPLDVDRPLHGERIKMNDNRFMRHGERLRIR